MRARFILFPFLLVLCACASNVPLEIREDISGEHITLDAVRSNVDRYNGHKVRWGGTISSVQNKATDTWIEVVGRYLGSYGRPQVTDQSEGRFLVRIDGFLDAAIYRVNRPITVYGLLEGSVSGNIGEYSYTYPLVRAYSHYLWNDYEPPARYAPYYDYPYGFYPYPYYFYPYRFDFGYRYGHFPRYYFGLHQRFPW
jgi:outer membrane lipoprotein